MSWMYISILIFLSFTNADCNDLLFSDDFVFGTATASYQIEGGWNASGKGENIWDHLTHTKPSYVKDRSNGDVACDSYNLYRDDVQLLSDMGVQFYRFSISWSRILPSGFADIINSDGIRYYNDLIDSLLQKNITPFVTLYHWDLPQPLQEIGGWPNPRLAEYYEDYVRVCFKYFGDRVKFWITFNEPIEVCNGYGIGQNAPAINSSGIGNYLCGHTLLLAHSRAYHLYNTTFRPLQRGKIGITISSTWFEPKTKSSENMDASERALQMYFGWWAHPIFSSEGDYPSVMKQRIAANSKSEGFPRSRLPVFTQSEIDQLKGSADFFGLNHYTTALVEDFNVTGSTPSFAKDVGVRLSADPKWKTGAVPWLKVVPWGFRNMLVWLQQHYNNPVVYVTENGYADSGELVDNDRIDYLESYLQELLKAIWFEKCNVRGYAVWSLIDNFEWEAGYTARFGLNYVYFNSTQKTRKAKSSAEYYKNVIRTRNPVNDPEVNMINYAYP